MREWTSYSYNGRVRNESVWVPKTTQQRDRTERVDEILEWRDAYATSDLPKWLKADLASIGLEVSHKIGGTTRQFSLWALRRIDEMPWDVEDCDAVNDALSNRYDD
jgi:hypothetical protein